MYTIVSTYLSKYFFKTILSIVLYILLESSFFNSLVLLNLHECVKNIINLSNSIFF